MKRNNLIYSFPHPFREGQGVGFPSAGRLLMVLMALLGTISASAYDFSAENAQGQTFYYNITGDNTVEVTNNGGNYIYRDVIIPSTVEYNKKTYTVTGIGACAFMSSSITSITLPNTITKIGGRAFSGCI